LNESTGGRGSYLVPWTPSFLGWVDSGCASLVAIPYAPRQLSVLNAVFSKKGETFPPWTRSGNERFDAFSCSVLRRQAPLSRDFCLIR
jgi:hypothetical protein